MTGCITHSLLFDRCKYLYGVYPIALHHEPDEQFVVNSAAVQSLPHVAMRKLCTVLPFVEEAASEIIVYLLQ